MLTPRDIKAVPYIKEETAIIGDVDDFIAYIESGQAFKEYEEKILALEKGFNEYTKEHPHVWDHIILLYA